jgi:hypothetical protein
MWVRIFFSFCGIGIWTQGFALIKQAPYCLSHTCTPFSSGYFGVLWTIWPVWPQTSILPISASQVARIIGMNHWHMAMNIFLSKNIQVWGAWPLLPLSPPSDSLVCVLSYFCLCLCRHMHVQKEIGIFVICVLKDNEITLYMLFCNLFFTWRCVWAVSILVWSSASLFDDCKEFQRMAVE